MVVRSSGCFGQIREIFDHGDRKLYHIHRIDTVSGKLKICLDGRCRGEHTCPIHGTNVEADAIDLLPSRDIEFYIREGVLDRTFVKEATRDSERTRRESLPGRHILRHLITRREEEKGTGGGS